MSNIPAPNASSSDNKAKKGPYNNKNNQRKGAQPSNANGTSSRGAPSNRNNQSNRAGRGSASNAHQESSSRSLQQLSREERGQNLQFRNINMQKYEQMIGSAKDNFADIPQSGGPVDECTICCKASDLFGLGSCRHPICIECAVRIRVLSSSNQCPVCRASMDTLWLAFVSKGLDTISLSFPLLNHPDEKRFGIRFENSDVVARYDKYLAHVCKICKSCNGERLEFPTFAALRHHMSSAHELTYCHICTEHIVLFSRERKTYTRDALQRHIRNGDRDDKSLKGHPSCLFCDQRFFDEEFRYRHLRKEHFFCQFCESEGKHMNVFFKDHGELLGHYKDNHFLCDVEECRAMGIAFSNPMDLNLHRSKEHAGRRAAVPIDFQFNDRQPAGPSRTRRDGGPPAAQNAPVPPRREKIAVVQQEQPQQPRRPPEEFVVVPSAQSRRQAIRYNIGPAFTPQNEDFPSLGNARSDPALNSLRPDNFPRLNRVNQPGAATNSASRSTNSSLDAYSGALPSSSHAAQKPKQQQPAQPVDEFPLLPASRVQGPSNSAWNNKKGKSVIVGCKMPTSSKAPPQPDIWPDRPVTTPAREIPPEDWKEVPAKPRKVDKKARRVQEKAPENGGHSAASEMQESSGSSLSSSTGDRPDPPTTAPTNLSSNASSTAPTGGLSKVTGYLPPVRERRKNVDSKKSPEADADSKPKEAVPAESVAPANETTSKISNQLAEVEKFVEDSAASEAQSSEAEPQKSSIFDWITTAPSSLLSNLSLSNLLGPRETEKKQQPMPPPSSAPNYGSGMQPQTQVTPVPRSTQAAPVAYSTSTFDDAPPPGFNTAPPVVNDLLAGPPPGFESAYPEDLAAPPGLAPPPSTSQPLFSMAPLLSHADLATKPSSATQNKPIGESDGWEVRGPKQWDKRNGGSDGWEVPGTKRWD